MWGLLSSNFASPLRTIDDRRRHDCHQCQKRASQLSSFRLRNATLACNRLTAQESGQQDENHMARGHSALSTLMYGLQSRVKTFRSGSQNGWLKCCAKGWHLAAEHYEVDCLNLAGMFFTQLCSEATIVDYDVVSDFKPKFANYWSFWSWT